LELGLVLGADPDKLTIQLMDKNSSSLSDSISSGFSSTAEIVSATPETLQLIRAALERIPQMSSRVRHCRAGEVLFKEGSSNLNLVVVLEGELELRKVSRDNLLIDRLGPGALAGLLSFTERRPSFSECRAVVDTEVLMLEEAWLTPILEEHPSFARLFDDLLLRNLAVRYKRVVNLNLEIAELSQALSEERNHLRETVEDLKRTRNQLIHREKLATLGQLLAGIAHEINNPGAALSRSSENLSKLLSRVASGPKGAAGDLDHLFLEGGIASSPPDSGQQRGRLEALSRRFPKVGRALLRRVSLLDPALAEDLDPFLKRFPEAAAAAEIERRLTVFEIGSNLRAVRAATDRILRLITSLKHYGRPDDGGESMVDLQEGITDTLTILSNRLKGYQLRLDLEECPPIRGFAGELNQVWTNLIVNACDATPEGGAIGVSLRPDGGGVLALFEDSGPGIPEELRERVFETNFTTKKGATDFGLGLGLAISREIVEKHEGSITIGKAEWGGARIEVRLPLGNRAL